MASMANYENGSATGARPVRRPIGDGGKSGGGSGVRSNVRVEDRRPVNDGDTSVEPTVTYTKLKSGVWGVRVRDDEPKVGQVVEVEKKDGEIREETIAKVVDAVNGYGGRWYLCEIQKEDPEKVQATEKQVEAAHNMMRYLAALTNTDEDDLLADITMQHGDVGEWSKADAGKVIDRLSGEIDAAKAAGMS